MKPEIIYLGHRNEFIFFLESPAPEVASSNNGLLKACSFSHMYLKEFLPLSTIKDKIILRHRKSTRTSIC